MPDFVAPYTPYNRFYTSFMHTRLEVWLVVNISYKAVISKGDKCFFFLYLQDYMRIVEQRRLAINRGASQTTIERNTFPHKYKKVKRLPLKHDKCI